MPGARILKERTLFMVGVGASVEMHLAMAPTFLGHGESLFKGTDLPGLGYRVMEVVQTELATHLVLTR
jgi:hypothetical protein